MPSPTLPHAKDFHPPLPNAYGLGSGMADCTLNNALLSDAYATRLEIGCGTPDDDRIFDRLIGGIIRLATIAPRNTVIRGLAPDGKSFYPRSGMEPVLYWAYAAWRTSLTPTVAFESQGKIRNICQHWMENLEQNQFLILNRDEDLNAPGWASSLVKPALLGVAYALTGVEKWKEQALALLNLAEAAPEKIPGGATRAEALFNRQLALRLLLETLGSPRPEKFTHNPEKPAEEPAEPTPLARDIAAAMNGIARAAAGEISAFKDFPPAALEETPTLDWTEIKEDGVIPWPRLVQENAKIAAPALAALAALWAPDLETARAAAEDTKALLLAIPWEKLWLGRALTATALLHAQGVTRGLWDEDLREFTPSFDGSASLVERFLDPAYDRENAEKAGHSEAAPAKEISYLYGNGGEGGEKRKGGQKHGREKNKHGKPQPCNREEHGAESARAENGETGERPEGRPGGGRGRQRSRRHGKNRGGRPGGGNAPEPLADWLAAKRGKNRDGAQGGANGAENPGGN